MRLVVDASVLVAELLRDSGRVRIASDRLQLVAAEHTLAETRHEILRRTSIIGERRGMTPDEVTQWRDPIFEAIATSISPVDIDAYETLKVEAARRIPRDPNDWHVVATALVMDCGIWTSDQDFFGCGIASWSTAVIDGWLTERDAVS